MSSAIIASLGIELLPFLLHSCMPAKTATGAGNEHRIPFVARMRLPTLTTLHKHDMCRPGQIRGQPTRLESKLRYSWVASRNRRFRGDIMQTDFPGRSTRASQLTSAS